MRQLFHDLRTGELRLAEQPAPAPGPRQVLMATHVSLISPGTERMLLEFGRSGLLGKARRQPARVRQVLDKVRTDGLVSTWEAVRGRLAEPLPLGYASAGHVLSIGDEVTELRSGDRVVATGPHAEAACVAQTLCAPVPDQVSDLHAPFAVLGAVALQGLRLARPALGEAVAVTGLGLIGLLAVQLLRAQGCHVLGVDMVESRLALARQFGAQTVNLAAGEDPIARAREFAEDGRGLDGVLVCTATDASGPVRQAAHMCRRRGRIVLVGTSDLHLDRRPFYDKELSFQVSCAYGPGRYDPSYEAGHDYPPGLVRWTAQRNIQTVLDLLASGRLDVAPLLTHRIPFLQAPRAYDLLRDPGALGVVFEYGPEKPPDQPPARTVEVSTPPSRPARTEPQHPVVCGVIGAGAHARRVLLPALLRGGGQIRVVASRGGASAAQAAHVVGAERSTTDPDVVLGDPEVRAVVIATRHDTHADYVCRALRAGKHVFVEKPLCLHLHEVDAVSEALDAHAPDHRPVLMVGYNRRFAPCAVRMRELLDRVSGPKTLVVTVNAGSLSADHWTRDPNAGGGRLLGEGCHFLDLLRFLTGAHATTWHVEGPRPSAVRPACDDSAVVTLRFADGSVGTLLYLADGHRRFPKERIEVFGASRVLILDNWRRLYGYGWGRAVNVRLWRQDKGHARCIQAFVEAVRAGGPPQIPISEIFEVARLAIDVASVR